MLFLFTYDSLILTHSHAIVIFNRPFYSEVALTELTLTSVKIVYILSVTSGLNHSIIKFTIGKCLQNDKHTLLYHKLKYTPVIFWVNHIRYGIDFDMNV